MRELIIKITKIDGTIEKLTALASAIEEVRRDLDSDPTVKKWEVEC